MHNIDRAIGELEMDYDDGVDELFVDEPADEPEGEEEEDFEEDVVSDLDDDDELEESDLFADDGGPLSESEEMELASDLMAVSGDDELEQFLGKLFRKVKRRVRRFAKRGVGRFLRRGLKRLAKKALPIVGGALGTAAVPGLGSVLGGNLGSVLSGLLQGELEGMSPEDQQFETARRFVRLAAQSTADASQADPEEQEVAPGKVAKTAIVRAARGLSGRPGLARSARAGIPRRARGSAQTGRWIRRGKFVILIGA